MTLGGGSFCRCIWSDSEVCFQGKTGEGNRKMDERERGEERGLMMMMMKKMKSHSSYHNLKHQTMTPVKSVFFNTGVAAICVVV